MILQLNPPLHMHTSKGAGIAQLVIDYGLEADLMWVVALNDSGEIWCFPNWDVRLYGNESAGALREGFVEKPIRKSSKIEPGVIFDPNAPYGKEEE